MSASHRVIQWATGSVGRETLKAILLHPALELAAVLVHSREKSGKDAGDLCDAPRTGILATSDKDAVVAATIDEHVQAASVATAMQAVNLIPALCEAAPGWRSGAELGLVRTGIGSRDLPGR